MVPDMTENNVAGTGPRSIGGYFELELPQGRSYHSEAVALNSARNCIRYLIRIYEIDRLYVPAYTCPVVWQAAKAEGTALVFYNIDANLYPTSDFPPDAFLLYTNYFGLCSGNVRTLEQRYPNLLVDNSQSFYSRRMGLSSFCSPRKFFGVPDGGYLYTDKLLAERLDLDCSMGRVSHLLLRHELGARAGYADFQKNDASLEDAPIRQMSRLTQRLLSGIDYEIAAKRRKENFAVLQECLGPVNGLSILDVADTVDVPMAYPFLASQNGLRDKLAEADIFVPCYWKGQRDPIWGARFERNLLPLPIDHRYHQEDMQKIADTLCRILKG